MKGMVEIEFKKIEEGVIPIYENESRERLINARELFYALRGEETKTKYNDWIENISYKIQPLIEEELERR